ncbi:MAG: hypothetical protein ACFFAN_05380 [Promethearchaeota archaeon]
MIRDIKIEITPSKGFVLHKLNGQDWKLYYSISGPLQNACNICGYPLKSNEKCTHHKGLELLSTPFCLEFVGYYQTDIQGRPTNHITKRVLEMKSLSSEKYYLELFLLLNTLYETLPNKGNIIWGMWVPSTNQILNRIASDIIINNKLIILNPLDFIDFNERINDDKSRLRYVSNKYKKKQDFPSQIEEIVNGNEGIVIDDLFHTGFTLGKIGKILENFSPKKIIGLVITRTTRGKHPMMLRIPNIP